MVQFYPWFKFSFLLFLGMVMYDNNMIMSLKQKKRKFEPKIKLNHNIDTGLDLKFTSPPCFHRTCESRYFFAAKDSLQISHSTGLFGKFTDFGNTFVLSKFSPFLVSIDFLIPQSKSVRFMSTFFSTRG